LVTGPASKQAIENRDVATRFQISDTTANRLLADMTAKGLIRQIN